MSGRRRPVSRGLRAQRGVVLVELVLVGFLLLLLLDAAVMLAHRFLAPPYRLLVWGAGVLMMGAYLHVLIAQLRYLGRTASLWAEAGRRARDFRRACADFARELPEGWAWSSKRGLSGDGAELAPEVRERLVHAAECFQRILDGSGQVSMDAAIGELIVRRRGDHWLLLWRVEGGEERVHSEGPLSDSMQTGRTS